MFKLPLLVVYSVIALNISAVSLLLQLDWLPFQSIVAKVIGWGITAVAWIVTYVNRNRYVTLK